ncbi:hypothetical protein GCM10008932_11160 [Alkalibacterium iburiense]|uniref:Uncharacterized protein n=1 Tax=Alkalibacterium iburiense TaxID=290589 RepID=A0ABN0XBU5_9LACT
MQINIKPVSQDSIVSEKEKQITQIAVLNFIALISALTTKQGAVSNPLKESEKDNIGYEAFLETTSQEEEKEFRRRIFNQVITFLTMSEVPYSVEITD